MRVYAIGDLHLSMDNAVEKPMDIFGGAWNHHAEKLEEYWRAIVQPEDTVIIPGDISWALYLQEAMADLVWIDSLPGTKILLRGNHDPWWSSMAKMRGLFDSIKFIQNDAYLGNGFIVFGSRGWILPGDKMFNAAEDQKIYEREFIRLTMARDAAKKLLDAERAEGRNPVVIGAMHYPPTNDKKEYSEFTNLFESIGTKIVVYGHLHGQYVFGNGPSGMINDVEYRCCSLDKLECIPSQILYIPTVE